MKKKNRLLNFKDKYIYQDDEWFSFSLDSLLLSNFVTINLSDKVIVDFCSGNAPILMFLSYRTKAMLYGIEIQDEIYKLGVESILINKFEKQIGMINDDVLNVTNYFDLESVDLVICNPPYFKYTNDKMINNNTIKAIARHEIKICIKQIVEKASMVLKRGGRLSIVYCVDRLMEVFLLFSKYGFEIKKIQFVYPKINSDCNIVLIEGVKGGKANLKVLKPLFIHNEDGSYCDKIKEMFQEH